MKTVRVIFIVLGCILISSACTLADEHSSRLPDDGWWIRYVTTSKMEIINGTVREYTIKATYSLVGTVVEDNETYRWVEVTSVFLADGNENMILSKFLVSEKDLLESEQPLDTLKRGWLKINDTDVRAVVAGKGITPYNTRTIIFPGIWQKAERIGNERVVDYQQGRLTIPEGRTWQVTLPVKTLNTPNGKVVIQKEIIDYTGWFDRTTLPAIAAATIQTKYFRDDELESTRKEDIVIQDKGTDAKSKLPDNN